ncbi:MAG: hypothetical protein QXD60_01145 [Nanopusillaceae archaeon]
MAVLLGEREALAEILATFGGIEEAERWLSSGRTHAYTPRGFRVSRADVAEAVKAARRLMASGKTVWTYLWLPETWPAAAGWIHSVFGRVFWEQLPKLGLRPWGSYVREGWKYAGTPTNALAYAWQRLRVDLAERGLTLADLARRAWKEILAEHAPPPEEQPTPPPEERTRPPQEHPAPVEPSPHGRRQWVIPQVGTFTIYHEIPAEKTRELVRLWRNTLNQLRKVQYVITTPYEPLPSSESVLIHYRGRLWRIPTVLWERLQNLPLMIGTDTRYALVHWGRGFALLPQVVIPPEQRENIPDPDRLGVPLEPLLEAVLSGDTEALDRAVRERMRAFGTSQIGEMVRRLRQQLKRRYAIVVDEAPGVYGTVTLRREGTGQPPHVVVIRPEEASQIIRTYYDFGKPFVVLRDERSRYRLVVLYPLDYPPIVTPRGPVSVVAVSTIPGSYLSVDDALAGYAYVALLLPKEMQALEEALTEITSRTWPDPKEARQAVSFAMEAMGERGVDVDALRKAFEFAAQQASQWTRSEYLIEALEENLRAKQKVAVSAARAVGPTGIIIAHPVRVPLGPW